MMSDEMQLVLAVLGESSPLDAPSLAERRQMMEAMMGASGPVEGSAVEPVDAGGVPGRWVRTPGVGDAVAAGGAVLYLHGGAYVLGSAATHTPLASHLSAAADLPVLVVDYRLAPEHPFPAALDDARAALSWLDEHIGPAPVAVAGDSAGGGLTLALLMARRDAGESLPAAAVCLSPWTDLTMTSAAATRLGDTDPVITPSDVVDDAALYAAGEPLDAPLISPCFGDLSGLPPLLLHVAAGEALLDDSVTVARKVAEAGGEVSLSVVPDVFHVWHATAGATPEADRAVVEVGAFLRDRMPS